MTIPASSALEECDLRFLELLTHQIMLVEFISSSETTYMRMYEAPRNRIVTVPKSIVRFQLHNICSDIYQIGGLR